jgi:hypothetical protein
MPRARARPLRALLGVACLLSLAPIGAEAQGACSCPAPIFPARWSVFVSTGGATVETSQINALLGTAGFFAVSNDAIGFGGGGFGSFGPLRIGAEHVRLDGGEESGPTGLSARIEASYTTLTLGWDLRPRGRLSLAPTIGVGRGSYVLTVGDRSDGATTPASPPPTFTEILDAPGRSSRIAGGHWVFEPMLAGELLVVRSASQRRGITIGARAGYRVAPNRPDWEYRGDAVAGGPVDQAKGPILRLTVGVGGR